MLVPLPFAIRVDPRRDALRLEYAPTHYFTNTTGRYPCFSTRATLLLLLVLLVPLLSLFHFFSHLFSLVVPYFFVVIGIIAGRSFYITCHRYYRLSLRGCFYFFLFSLRLAINETFRRAKLGNFRRVHFEDVTMVQVRERWYTSRLTRLLCRFVFFADHFFPFPWVIEGQRRARLSA